MKKILAVAFAIAILSLGFNASAQVPFVQVYFDDYGTVGGRDCPPCGPEQIDVLSVFALNFNMWMLAIEYMIDYSPALSFLGDIANPGALNIGQSVTGISWSYPVIGNAFGPYRTQQTNVFWNCCDDCNNPPGYINSAVVVMAHPGSNPPATGPRAVEWQTFRTVDAIGMTSMICQRPVATQTSTWGGIKSLYNQ